MSSKKYDGSLTTSTVYDSAKRLADVMNIYEGKSKEHICSKSCKFGEKCIVDNHRHQLSTGSRNLRLSFRATNTICPHKNSEKYPVAINGKRQSPIDIATEYVQYDANLVNIPIIINYKPERRLGICNTGTSIQAEIKEKSEISGGPLVGKFQLEQFHFHWGSNSKKGSEHTLNGHAFAAELHLVHWNKSKYSSFKKAVDKEDGLAVFGFFIKAGKEHEQLKLLTDRIKKIHDKDAKSKLPEKFDPKHIMPAHLEHYWTYKGSLTTPPYYESVQWIVFSEVIEMSEEQLEDLRCMKSCSCDGKYIIDNYRKPLALGEREVRSSFQMMSTKL